jgi:integrase
MRSNWGFRMPHFTHGRPAYRRHRPSGHAIVEFGGKRHYLGPYGSPQSHHRYNTLVDTWIEFGRPRQYFPPPIVQGPAEGACTGATLPIKPNVTCGELSVIELVANFWEFAKERYEKYGRQTGTHENYRPALRLLKERYGELRVADFGPLCLKALQREFMKMGNSRGYVNDNVDRIRGVFSWGVTEECVPEEIAAALERVKAVPKGARGVVEHDPVGPVSDDVILATLKHLPPMLADMVRIQLLTGCRPGELCAMRPSDIDRTQEIWVYCPREHKTEHHGKERNIAIGPQAQQILRPYMRIPVEQPCFSPAASERKRSHLRREKRLTPLTPSQLRRFPKPNGRRRPGDTYVNDSYRRAIARACDKAFPPPKKLSKAKLKEWRKEHRWSPNQLRHAAATRICDRYESLVPAQQVLGHGSAQTTAIYAKPSLKLAKRVMAEMG